MSEMSNEQCANRLDKALLDPNYHPSEAIMEAITKGAAALRKLDALEKWAIKQEREATEKYHKAIEKYKGPSNYSCSMGSRSLAYSQVINIIRDDLTMPEEESNG